MWNAGLDEAQAGIKIAGRNINNLRYADDNTLVVEREKDLKSVLVKEKSKKAGLKLNIQKWRSWHPVLLFMTNKRGQMETVTDCIFLDSKITVDIDCMHEIKRCLLLGRKAMTNLHSKLKSRDITLPA